MLRREAVLLLREIFSSCQDATLVNFVALKRVTMNANSETENFELHLKAPVPDSALNAIQLIAEKHELLTMHSGQYMVIYSPQKPPVQTTDMVSTPFFS